MKKKIYNMNNKYVYKSTICKKKFHGKVNRLWYNTELINPKHTPKSNCKNLEFIN